MSRVSLGRVVRHVAWVIPLVMVAALTPSPAATASPSLAAHPSAPAVAPLRAGGGAKDGGSASAEAEALAQAAATGQRVEVVADRTETLTVWANPDGTLTQDMAQSPVRVQNDDGSWTPINLDLAADNGRLTPAASSADVSFSASGTGPLASFDTPGAGTFGLGFKSALSAPTVEDSTATYPVDANQAVQLQATGDGFDAHVVLAAAPSTAPTYRFPLTLSGGLVASLAKGELVLTDAGGTEVGRSSPLTMWDAQTDRAGDPANYGDVAATLVSTTGGGTELDLTPSMDYLTNDSTVYPVTVDPNVVSVQQKLSTWWVSAGSNFSVAQSASYRLLSGTDTDGTEYRAYVGFNPAAAYGKDVTSATLNIYQYDANSCTAKRTDLASTSAKATTSTVWSNQPSLVSNSEFATSASFNAGTTGCAAAFQNLDVTPIVNSWTSGEESTTGIELTAHDNTDTASLKRFCSFHTAPAGTGHCETTADYPTLSMTFLADSGVQSSFSMTKHTLNAFSKVAINNANGDAVVQAKDLHVTGLGLDLNGTRTYNSNQVPTGQFGTGWTSTLGKDVYLHKVGTGRYDYYSATGTVFGTFVRHTTGDTNSFSAPKWGGSDLKLEDNAPGSGPDTFTITMRKSGEQYVVSDLGVTGGDLFLSKDIDRNGNEIDYAYNGSNQLSSITDTQGRTYSIGYNTSGFINAITDTNGPSTRTWGYAYTGSLLTGYTDPLGNVTTYNYTSGLLTSIVDPSPRTGVTPTATLGYSSLQATSIKYATSATTNNEYDFAFTTSPTTGVCNGADRSAAVTDPRSHTTSYCFIDRTEQSGSDISTGGDAVLYVFDGLGNQQSTSYSADTNAYSSTTAGNQASANPSVNSYDSTTQALTSATEPTNTAGDTAAATHTAYGNKSTSVPGGDFNPTSVQTSDGYCTAYVYDPSTGDLTDSYPALVPSSGTDCTGQTNSHHYGADYNSDGTVQDSFDPNGSRGSTPDETTFSYATSGDTRGDLTQKIGPGGSCASGSARNLCTQYTYDNLSRVATMTDGNNATTSYSYDKNNKITQVLLNGTSTCVTTAGTCITYTYDAEGNLTQRVDVQGTTTFGYDWLNRQTSQITPDGTEVDYGYDTAGNMTTYSQQLTGQTADVVTYVYDAADHYTKVTDSTGATTISENSDGKPNVTTFPTGVGVSFTDTYKASGKARAITPSTSSLPTLTYGYGYNGTVSERDQLQTQTSNTSGTAVTQSYTYGPAARLTDIDFSDTTPHRHYGYDVAGNLTSSVSGGGATVYYGYNEDNQWCWSGTTTTTLQVTLACPTMPPAPAGDTAYTADKAGNFTGTTAGPITYNTNNQATTLTAIAGGTAVAQAYLDQGNDFRVTAGADSFVNGLLGVTARKNTGGITYYTRDPNGHLIDEHGATGTQYYYADRNHTVLNLIGSTGAITATYTYSTYGTPTASGTASADNPWRYTGGFYDIQGDNYTHLGARYYAHGDHFTQPDPNIGTLANPQSANGYDYANGDPINNVDPSGKCGYPFDIFACGGELLASGVSSLYSYVPSYGTVYSLAGGCYAGVSAAQGTIGYPLFYYGSLAGPGWTTAAEFITVGVGCTVGASGIIAY